MVVCAVARTLVCALARALVCAVARAMACAAVYAGAGKVAREVDCAVDMAAEAYHQVDMLVACRICHLAYQRRRD